MGALFLSVNGAGFGRSEGLSAVMAATLRWVNLVYPVATVDQP